MNNLILLDELCVNYDVKYIKTDEEIPLKDVRLLSSAQERPKSNCVYLTNAIGLVITDFICQYFKTETEHLTLSQNTNYFVERLLQGLDVDDRVLEHYLSQRGWHTEGKYLLANFPVSLNNDPLAAQSQLIRIERHFSDTMAFLHEGSVVTVTSIPADRSCEQICQNIRQFTYDTSLLCGASDRFYHFSHMKYAYIQSKIALKYADETNRFLSFPVDYAGYTVAALGNSISLKAMCHPAILKLAESDNDFDSILINNLKTYLMYGCSIQDTANALFIHRNTLLYRLDKISRALGTDVRGLSGNDRFYLLMSCIICEEAKNITANK